MKKNILITGASSGLGAAFALSLAKNGANLALSARRRDRLENLRDEIFKVNNQIDVFLAEGDVADKSSCKELVEKSVKHFGALDTVIANAGQGMWTRFRDLSDPDQLQSLMQVNYMGVVYSLFYSLPELRKNAGSFVAISSIQGVIPVAYHTGYVASKYAVNGLIETIRLEEPDVHFLLALPSWISGTELRSHAVSGSGENSIEVKKSHGKNAVSAKDCAELILKALSNKKRELFIPKVYGLTPLLRYMLPESFDAVVMKKIKGQLK